MIKKKFGELRKGDLFYFEWDMDEPNDCKLICCMKCEYEDPPPTNDECKWCDYICNAIWLDYKPGTMDWASDDCKVWVDEKD